MERRSKITQYFATALILAIASIGTNANAAESEVQLNWQLAPTDRAGSQKSGAACFPNGALLWREIAKPESQLVDSRLKALLELHGAGEASASGDVTSLKAMVCLPWLGIGAQPKSEIKLSIRWTLILKGQQPSVHSADVAAARKQFDLRADANLLLEAIETSFREALSRVH